MGFCLYIHIHMGMYIHMRVGGWAQLCCYSNKMEGGLSEQDTGREREALLPSCKF